MANKPTYEELEQRVKQLEQAESGREGAEKSLKENEDKYRIYIEHANDGISVVHKGKITFVNSRLAEIMGFKVDELVGKDFLQFIPKNKLNQITDNLKRRLAGEEVPQVYESRILHKDGSEIDVEFNITTIESNDEPATLTIIRDITERKKAEKALQESENLLRNILDTYLDVAYKLNLETGTYEYLSSSIEKLMGFTIEEFINMGFKGAEERFHPEDRMRNEKHFNNLLSHRVEKEIEPTIEYRWKHKDGKYRWYSDNRTIIFDNDNKPVAIIGSVKDITGRKQAEDKLLSLSEMVKQSRDSIIRTDKDFRIIYSNNAARNLFGWSFEELQGKTPDIFNAEPLSDEIQENIYRIVSSGKTYIGEALNSRKDGSTFYCQFRVSPLFDTKGDINGYMGLQRDVTEHKLAEEALRESKERLRIQNQIANIFLTKKDEDMYGEILSVILDIMESKFGVFGYIGQQGELVCPSMTKDIWDQCQLSGKTIVFPEDTWGESIWGNGLRTGLSAYSNKPFKVPEGHIAVDRCLTVPIVYQQKSIGLFVVANKPTDYTESDKQLLEEIAERVAPVLNARIEKNRSDKALQESEGKLARANKIEAMGLMAGGVAHDLNNILSGIVSYPELLLMDLPEDSPLRKPIKTIQESGMRAADVVKDLLTIARGVASGKEVLNLNTLVTEYLGSAEHQKLERIHPVKTFKTELDSDLLNITGSASHVMKILMNLIGNASEAIEDKGTVIVSTMNRYLDEPLKGYEDVDTGEYVILTVSDDGSGISPTDLERIFEPFYTKKVMGRSGTGLGLSVVWNSMQDHDGYINVNTSKKGTTFELYFPTTREQIAADKEEVPLDDYIGHGEKVLVVDDEERQREIAGGILTRLGYTAETVSSGEEAIEYMKENTVDLIVLDMVMPKGIDGRETYEEIIKIHPGQKAIIASGYAKTKEVEMAQALGAGKYIMKPYTLAKVGAAVKEELEK